MLDDTKDTENTHSDTPEAPCEVPPEITQKLQDAKAKHERLLNDLADAIGKMLGE